MKNILPWNMKLKMYIAIQKKFFKKIVKNIVLNDLFNYIIETSYQSSEIKIVLC